MDKKRYIWYCFLSWRREVWGGVIFAIDQSNRGAILVGHHTQHCCLDLATLMMPKTVGIVYKTTRMFCRARKLFSSIKITSREGVLASKGTIKAVL
ncbi:hypothetical protein BDN70DRAFT_384058 [Pholiota conissans]|uniref:Uncharacterized protein n=1 Tax=Pholiota conissans TaxID=109636 RepID=A0A9P5YQU1_9AGAR|nr:hypothetical protein BDN70DRAFT_384058 [Pholiota conissans]